MGLNSTSTIASSPTFKRQESRINQDIFIQDLTYELIKTKNELSKLRQDLIVKDENEKRLVAENEKLSEKVTMYRKAAASTEFQKNLSLGIKNQFRNTKTMMSLCN